MLKLARLTHLYLTLFGLVLILFFAVSGFMLNHIDWFVVDDPPPRTEPTRKLPLEKFPNQRLPVPQESTGELSGEDKFALVETLRKEFAIGGEMTSLQVEPVESETDSPAKHRIKVEFRRAGETIYATIQPDATTEIVHKHKGWAGVMTDLHRGNRGNVPEEPRFTGRFWSFIIDGTAILMTIVSATGLILWSSLKSRGKWGALLLFVGGVFAFASYYLFTP
jgi:hypothetical protein